MNGRTVEIYIAVNEDGDYVANHDEDQAIENFGDEYGGSFELTKLNITLPLPKHYAREASATLPNDGSSEFSLTLTKSGGENEE